MSYTFGIISSCAFEWDEQKKKINIKKWGIDFADAPEIFKAPMLENIDDGDYGEERWKAIGNLKGRIVVVVFTYRGEDIIRIISLRKAYKHEREKYEQSL